MQAKTISSDAEFSGERMRIQERAPPCGPVAACEIKPNSDIYPVRQLSMGFAKA
jgi:hypothetical protein